MSEPRGENNKAKELLRGDINADSAEAIYDEMPRRLGRPLDRAAVAIEAADQPVFSKDIT